MAGSETRTLTQLVGVRFAIEDFEEVREAAERRGVSLPQLLRDACLDSVRAAS